MGGKIIFLFLGRNCGSNMFGTDGGKDSAVVFYFECRFIYLLLFLSFKYF
jgi:hypothetical protein